MVINVTREQYQNSLVNDLPWSHGNPVAVAATYATGIYCRITPGPRHGHKHPVYYLEGEGLVTILPEEAVSALALWSEEGLEVEFSFEIPFELPELAK